MQSIPDNAPEKKCTGPCERTLPATPENFHRNKNTPDKLCRYCKQCVSGMKKKRRLEHPDENKVQCKQWYENNKEYALERYRQWRIDHPEEKREQDRQWRIDHLQEKTAKDRVYKQEHAEELAAKQRARYAANPEAVSLYQKEYYQTDRGIVAKRVSAHNRRSRKKNAPGKHTTAQLWQLYHEQEGKCFHCGIQLGMSRNSWHGDHLVPLSKGGTNDISNIVVSCPPCNLNKSNKLPHQWKRGTQ